MTPGEVIIHARFAIEHMRAYTDALEQALASMEVALDSASARRTGELRLPESALQEAEEAMLLASLRAVVLDETLSPGEIVAAIDGILDGVQTHRPEGCDARTQDGRRRIGSGVDPDAPAYRAGVRDGFEEAQRQAQQPRGVKTDLEVPW